jgi:RNA polymerase sigma-70 factor (ECF subfamily)
MVDLTEPSLAHRAREGDVDAFSQLVKMHDNPMRALAYRMLGSQAAMDDALQAAYLKAFRSIGTLHNDAAFPGWLRRIVVNCCNDQLRSQRRRGEVALDAIGHEPSEPAAADRVDERHRMTAALMTLPPDMRAVVILVDGEGLTYEEAAETLGIERGTVGSRLNRARAALRHQLGLGEEIR